MSLRNKNNMLFLQVQLFSVFLFSLTAALVFFSFLIKAFANFENLIRFYWHAFIVHRNGENLKMLMEIFCQKLKVSNVILLFLDHLKPKIVFVSQPWWPTQNAIHFQSLWIRPRLLQLQYQTFQGKKWNTVRSVSHCEINQHLKSQQQI